MTPFEVAVTMFHREHDRWNQWALFFFGSVVSVFVLWANLKSVIPLWIPALAAFVLSVFWVMVALNVRASTYTWRAVAQAIEESPGGAGSTFALYKEKAAEFSRSRDLWVTITHWRTESFLSTVLAGIGVVAMSERNVAP